MPLEWTIDHALRMVTVIAEGEVTLGQAEEYLDAVVVADAMPYAKLVDCTNMVTNASDDDMMQLAARIRAYATVLQGGPLCFVVATPEMLDHAPLHQPQHRQPAGADLQDRRRGPGLAGTNRPR
jgi:hypothetical protein